MSITQTAIIGCGTIATAAHMPGYKAASDIANVKYFVDIIPERAEKLRDAYGSGIALTDYRDMLGDSDVTCVSVCTPNYLHAPITIDLLNAGKHVLCEKPASVNANYAAAMQRAANENGRILNIGVVNRYNTAVCRLARLIEEGELGELYHIYCSFRAHRSIPGLGGPFTNKKLAGGGVLIDWGVHYLDLILYCAREPKVRSASAAAYNKLGKDINNYVYTSMWAGPPVLDGLNDVEEFVTGFIRTDGPTISLNGAWAQNIGVKDTYIDFLGDKGGARLTYGGDFTLYSTRDGMLTETSFAFEKEEMYNSEIRDFLLNAQNGVKSKANIDRAIETSKLMDLLYESAEIGREIQAGI
ncbi:MAG: Gfo/Idh/MocA family oxidoreductase [Oscillospiraceae bacterium]|jgi:predicted dehydrogenase|nr:Gfo/Idh/MocA family oxidoreductase [Oscillospiraceae bacterium]